MSPYWRATGAWWPTACSGAPAAAARSGCWRWATPTAAAPGGRPRDAVGRVVGATMRRPRAAVAAARRLALRGLLRHLRGLLLAAADDEVTLHWTTRSRARTADGHPRSPEYRLDLGGAVIALTLPATGAGRGPGRLVRPPGRAPAPAQVTARDDGRAARRQARVPAFAADEQAAAGSRKACGFDIADGLIAGWYDAATGRGAVRVKAALLDGRYTRIFEQLLYQAHASARRRLEQPAWLVHSSAVIVGGQGFLFVGPSGAGKSTVARLSAAPSRAGRRDEPATAAPGRRLGPCRHAVQRPVPRTSGPAARRCGRSCCLSTGRGTNWPRRRRPRRWLCSAARSSPRWAWTSCPGRTRCRQ